MDADEVFERGATPSALEEISAASTPSPRAVIITGLSGSGKSTAMRALEDAGFFCIDNLPVPLLPKVLELAGGHSGEGRVPQQYAFAVDTRERNYLDHADQIIAQMRSEGVSVQVVFLEASDESLVRRYSETRRRHPMSDGGTVREGIERERERLKPLRLSADLIVDTTEHTVHTLKGVIQRVVARSTEPKLTITVISFGFKHGLPTECDLVFDVRFLPNPYFVEGLREMTGLDRPIVDYVMSYPEASRFVEHVQGLMEYVLPFYVREGKAYLTIGVGCTGGRHRSVTIAQILSSRLRGRGWAADIRHRDVRR